MNDESQRPIPGCRLVILSLIALLVTGCAAGRGAYNLGLEAELSRDYAAALDHYEQALAEKPGDIEYRLKVQQSRFAAAFQHFENGRRALEAGELELARMELIRAQRLDPTNSMTETELERVETLMQAGTVEESLPALGFDDRKELARTDPSLDRRLNLTLQEPISLTITQDAQAIFETIAELAGLNVIFDSDWNSTQLSIDLNNVSIYEALDVLALQTRTFWEPINQSTIVVSPDNVQKRQNYENTIVKTIYLTNSVNPTDLTEAVTAIRTILNTALIAQSSTMNAIIMRDTPDRIAIAEKIIDDFDKSRPEVLVEATVLEVDRNTLRDLGILPPQGTQLGLDGSGDAGPGSLVNLRDLNNLNSGSFNIAIPPSVARFLASDTRTRMVQNPSIRATDGSVASIHIGSRVPVASGSFQPAFTGTAGTPVVQFDYIDVGVNLDITPRVLLNREISMQVVVQVTATAGTSLIGGVALPIFTNRSISHQIQLNEGETNILGGLIADSESTAVTGIPLLNRIPFLNRIFSSEKTQRDQTEIIVLLTPHIVEMPVVRDRNLLGLDVGTATDTRLRSLPGGPVAPAALPEPAPGPEADDPAPATPEGDDAVRFDTPEITLEPGTRTDVVVRIDADGVTGADLIIEFDPASVVLHEVADGGFLSQDGVGISLARNIDTVRGRAVVSMGRGADSLPVSGEGAVLLLILEGLELGESVVGISDFRVHTGPSGRRAGHPAEVRIVVQ